MKVLLQKKMLLGIFSAIAVFSFTPFSSAHVLKHDKSIGAVLHISPGDDPATNEVATFNLEITDTEKKFDATECQCRYILKSGDEVLLQSGFLTEKTASGTDFFNFTYTFEKRGIYTLEVSGKPRDGLFNPFSLEYDIRVSREGQGEAKHQNALYPVLISVGLVMLLVLTHQRINKHKKIN